MAKLPTVAIVGQTNVGKSSLFNRLYGSQEAIVAREAGTTRDNVVRKITVDLQDTPAAGGARRGSAQKFSRALSREFLGADTPRGPQKFTISGAGATGPAGSEAHKHNSRSELGEASAVNTRSYWLVDTAGLKDAEDEFEASIQDQISEATELADVILVVLDSTQYPTDQDRQIAKKALKSKKPVILVLNKVDLKGALPNEEFLRLGIKTIQRTSAEHAQGLGTLRTLILDNLPSAYEQEPDDVLRIALIGRPNVGKSHLFNTLAGKQQAIVANIAGTTRDVNRVAVKYHTRDLELLDTAGIRRSGKQEQGIEKFSVLRTLAAIDEADICLLLMDVNELSTQLDQKIAGLIKEAGKGLVLVVSKWDSVAALSSHSDDEFASDRLGNRGNAADRKSGVSVDTSDENRKALTKSDKQRRAKSLRSGSAESLGKDAFTRDALAPQIAHEFAFVPWAPLIFTSSVTGQNVTKLFDLAIDIDRKRHQELKTTELNKILQTCLRKHPPAGLKNTHPKLRYMVQTDVAAPWFVIFGSNLKFLHWSYKRYLEHAIRAEHDFSGTPLMFSFRDEKQIKANREKEPKK